MLAIKKIIKKVLKDKEDWIITARRDYANNLLKKKEYNGNLKELSSLQISQIDSFWKKYNDKANKLYNIKQYEVYNKYWGGVCDISKFLPDDFYYCYIDLFFTNYHISVKLDNKNLYDLYFSDVERPKCILRNIGGVLLNDKYDLVSLENGIRLCQEQKNIIIKKTINSDGGHGVIFIDDCTTKENELREYLNSNEDFIIQEIINQHDVLGQFNQNSVNTIRIMTLFLDGEIKVLSSVLRMGINGAKVDNASSGGIVCGINSDGSLKNRAFDSVANVYYHHPQGMNFEGVVIPFFSDCINTSKRLANRFINYSKLISWDFSVDKYGRPILIEANFTGGQLDFHQLCNGPIFEGLTDSILNLVL